MTNKPDKLASWLNRGVEAQEARMASATLYERTGPNRERETGAGMTTFVRPLLDPRLQLSPAQRAIGQTFGAFYERAACGPSSSFLREYVDSGRAGSGGYSESHAHICRQVAVARATLRLMAPVTYRLGRRQKGSVWGPHKPITCERLMIEACVNGHTMTRVGLDFGWWVERQKKAGKGKKRRPKHPSQPALIVPGRQRLFLGEELRRCLDKVGEFWEDAGFCADYSFGTVETE